MKLNTTIRNSISARILLMAALLAPLSVISSHAGSATWNLNPASGDWNTLANWTPANVPNSQTDVATFDASSVTTVSTATSTIAVSNIIFNPGASAYTINNTGPHYLGIFQGVVNNSGVQQKIVTGSTSSTTGFYLNASAGSNVLYTISPGATLFFDSFNGFPSADHATFANSGIMLFYGGTAADAIISSSGTSSQLWFMGNSTAENAILTMDGGEIFFEQTSTGDEAQVELSTGGRLSVYPHAGPGVTIGSLKGNGVVNLGSVNWLYGKTLTVGSNGLSTTFSGTMNDAGKVGGLTKIGAGTLVLTNASTYTDRTLVKRGALIINNITGSGTGTGPVQVNSGALGGKGIIAGAVRIGGGTQRASLAPGTDAIGLLTIQSGLTFDSNAAYEWNIEVSASKADEVVAQGVTIDGSASFTVVGHGSATLTTGTVFTVISNTAATPIAGTFGNLADGGTIAIGGNNFEANYEGGDGNDLTLTVVP